MSMRMARLSLVLMVLVVLSSSVSVASAEVTAVKSDDGSKVVIAIDGKPFAEYLTLSVSKPIVWPIIGPTGKPMSRQYPMLDKAPDEKDDHIHHRSLWFGHGNVNGHNFWNEPSEKRRRQGVRGELIKHREYLKIESGKEAVVTTVNDWLDPKGKKVLEDERTLRFGGNDDARWIDFDITLRAIDGPVTFGDTKEGTMSIRVAAPLKPDAKKGGRLTNSEGQVDGQVWAQRASWVDYSGKLDGEPIGICIMNHPTSFRYPTHWHARTYGLGAANPFGWHDFEQKDDVDGSYTIPQGESMTLRYRFLFHKGDAAEANLPEEFKKYAATE
ncbi:MAG: hypothetical protein GX621_12010 [Pirellulaceae bacterium]|nr:hypothetical protein [Pirellulaceae bacterium]